MKNTLSKVLIFAAGAAVGSVVTWKLVEEAYKKIAADEIASVQEYYSDKYDIVKPADEDESEDDEEGPVIDQNDIREYAETLLSNRYTDYANGGVTKEKTEEVTEVRDTKGPYVISPDEYAANNDYDNITYTCYADGVVTDMNNQVMRDVEDILGIHPLDHFGDYEEDSVYVRNDELEIDYEILLDYREYSDIVKSNTHRTGVE